jgi:serine/threonine protein kinase
LTRKLSTRKLLWEAAHNEWTQQPAFSIFRFTTIPTDDRSNSVAEAWGITYKAFDVNLRCDVALKVISPMLVESESARQRFFREARAAAALRHPHVAAVHHLGEEGGTVFYAMEFIEGETLEALIAREGRLDERIALGILDQVAEALGAAMRLGLVHRDIKPSNLMLRREFDGRLCVKIIDFGLAKGDPRPEITTSATLTAGGFVGTPHYASPEQLEELPLDARSDIYSLGITFYYMLCGKPPFSGSTASVISQHLTREIPLDALAGRSPEVIHLIREMAAKRPDARRGGRGNPTRTRPPNPCLHRSGRPRNLPRKNGLAAQARSAFPPSCSQPARRLPRWRRRSTSSAIRRTGRKPSPCKSRPRPSRTHRLHRSSPKARRLPQVRRGRNRRKP